MTGQKLLIICGPTATGKTDLGIKIAKKFNGEIISADSRQVYKGMDIGTGKDLPVNSKIKNQNAKLQFKNKKLQVGYRLKDGVPIWLVDIVEPDYMFNVGEYAQLAQQVIRYLWNQGTLPIVVGGTGLYLKALVEPIATAVVLPDEVLRARLEQQDVTVLQETLKRLDQERFNIMNHSDRYNPRRLIRAIEIVSAGIPINTMKSLPADTLLIGLKVPLDKLQQHIKLRIEMRLKQGIRQEIAELLNRGYTWEMPAMSAIGYREWRDFFAEKKTQDQVVRLWIMHEVQYAKRQLTWFKKEKNIHWFDITKSEFSKAVEHYVGTWYNR